MNSHLSTDQTPQGTAVFVVIGQKYARMNDRVRKLLTLANHFSQITLVSPGEKRIGDGRLSVRPLPNPTGLLRLLRLREMKKRVDKFIFFPSSHTLFVASAFPKLKKQVEERLRAGQRVSVLTCTPPHTIMLLGYKLKKSFPQIRWINDWQDLWSYDDRYLEKIPKCYHRRLFALENKMLQWCDLNIVTNYNAAQVMQTHYNVAPDRIRVINHHFNPDDIAMQAVPVKKHPPSDKPKKIKIGFLGGLFKPPKVPGKKIVNGFLDLVKQGHPIDLNLYGVKPDKDVKAFLDGLADKGFLKLFPPEDHTSILKRMTDNDYLLLVLENLPNCNVIMHLKLPHYLIQNKPIIALVPEESFAADTIRKTGAGFVIPLEDGWPQKMMLEIDRFQCGDLVIDRNEDEIEKYSWDQIHPQWLQVLNGARIERSVNA